MEKEQVISKDLKKEMPTAEGLSVTNLRYCRRFYLLYSNLITIHPQAGGRIRFWSRNPLLNWIDTDLFERSGKPITNFVNTLPDSKSNLAQEITKDPYNFAFAGVTEEHKVLK
ncbi:MAG: hypothetical protein II461_05055 [Treponema sp.]|nr:hypothetical protein [Treponema sp.]